MAPNKLRPSPSRISIRTRSPNRMNGVDGALYLAGQLFDHRQEAVLDPLQNEPVRRFQHQGFTFAMRT